METPTHTAPPVALDRLVRRCVTHHHACDCREALMHECLVMLAVFRGCMVTRTLPTSDSPCARKVCELLTTLDPTGELAPDNFAAGGGTDAESRILPRSLPPVAIPSENAGHLAPPTQDSNEANQ